MSLIHIENKISVKEIEEMLENKQFETVVQILRMLRTKYSDTGLFMHDVGESICTFYDINPHTINFHV